MSAFEDEGSGTRSRYERLGKIATGGMATVFVGRARGAVGFSRLVAIKKPHPFVSEDPALRKGLEYEARIASMIHHPHVVSVLDVELQGDDLSLILDYVDGGSLSDIMAHTKRTGTRLPAGVAIRIALDVASGLHAAHVLRGEHGEPLGIVHRDVSPQNVLVGLDGLARLTDFGIAKAAEALEQTATNVMKGKIGYLPPEYIEARTFDVRSDEHALAVVAWEALTAQRLFRGANDLETMQHILERGPLPPSAVHADLAPLDPVFARALARDPSDRFASVAAFAETLEDVARRYMRVASSREVAAVVEEAVGDTVRARRSSAESMVALRAGVARSSEAMPSMRDVMSTISIANVHPPLQAAVPLPFIQPQPRPGRRRALVGVAVGVTTLVGALGVRQATLPAAASTDPGLTVSAASAPSNPASATSSVDANLVVLASSTAAAPPAAPPASAPASAARTQPHPSPLRKTPPLPAASHLPRAPPNPYGP